MINTSGYASARFSKVTQFLRRPRVYVCVAALAGAGLSVGAQGPHPQVADTSDIGRMVAGTYLLDVRHDGFPPALALVTLTSEGGFISTDVSDQGAGGLSTTDSPVHGTWKPVGRRTLRATTFYFGFDPEGIPKWIGRTKGSFRFDGGYKTGTGTLRVERFRLDQDPLDPDEVPADVLNATLTARRISVE